MYKAIPIRAEALIIVTHQVCDEEIASILCHVADQITEICACRDAMYQKSIMSAVQRQGRERISLCLVSRVAFFEGYDYVCVGIRKIGVWNRARVVDDLQY